MRIIQRGISPDEIEYEHRCSTCSTLFAFYKKDLIQKCDQRENDTWYDCKCPHCNRNQYIRTLTPHKKPTSGSGYWDI